MRAIRRHSRPTVAAVAPLAAVALLLAGCSGGDDAGAEGPSGEATTPAEETTEPADDEVEDDAAASDGASCVEGTWVSDPAAQAEQATAALGTTEIDAQASVTGDSLTTIEGSDMTTEYRDQVVEVSWELEGQEFRMVTTWSGTLTGTIEVTADQVVVSGVDASALEMAYETYVNGQLLDIPAMEDIPLSGFAADGTSTYTCTGDELRLTPVVEGLDTSAVTTVLHRQD